MAVPREKDKSLVYENAPDWLVAYMHYRRSVLGNTVTPFTYLKMPPRNTSVA